MFGSGLDSPKDSPNRSKPFKWLRRLFRRLKYKHCKFKDGKYTKGKKDVELWKEDQPLASVDYPDYRWQNVTHNGTQRQRISTQQTSNKTLSQITAQRQSKPVNLSESRSDVKTSTPKTKNIKRNRYVPSTVSRGSQTLDLNDTKPKVTSTLTSINSDDTQLKQLHQDHTQIKNFFEDDTSLKMLYTVKYDTAQTPVDSKNPFSVNYGVMDQTDTDLKLLFDTTSESSSQMRDNDSGIQLELRPAYDIHGDRLSISTSSVSALSASGYVSSQTSQLMSSYHMSDNESVLYTSHTGTHYPQHSSIHYIQDDTIEVVSTINSPVPKKSVSFDDYLDEEIVNHETDFQNVRNQMQSDEMTKAKKKQGRRSRKKKRRFKKKLIQTFFSPRGYQPLKEDKYDEEIQGLEWEMEIKRREALKRQNNIQFGHYTKKKVSSMFYSFIDAIYY